jgi:hypothetical protein
MNVLPRIGEDITLTVPQREHLRVRVLSMGAGVLELDLVESPHAPMGQLIRARAFLEYVNDEGFARLHGQLQRGDEPRLVSFTHSGRPVLLQRRSVARAIVARPLTLFRVGERDAIAIGARTVKVAADLLVVRGIPSPRVGENYEFELDLVRGEPPITGRFRVEMLEDRDAAVVHFTVLDQRGRARLEQFAFEASRRRVA